MHLKELLLKARSWSSYENGLKILASKKEHSDHKSEYGNVPWQQMLCTAYVMWTGSLWSSSVTQASNSTRQELLVSLLLCLCSRHFQYFYLLFGNHQLNIIPSIQTTTTGHVHFEIIQVFMYYPRLAASLYCTTFWKCSNKSAAMTMVTTLESHFMGASEKSKKKKSTNGRPKRNRTV